MIGRALLAVLAGAALACEARPAAPVARHDAVRVPAGEFAPLFGLDAGQGGFPVAEFWLDRRPVTRAQFAAFIAAQPQWAPGRVAALYADAQYLRNWDGGRPAADRGEYPVTYVSWFAAQAYCHAQGGRLPSTLEWEYAAAASETRANAQRDPAFAAQILAWYAQPNQGDAGLQPVGRQPPNHYGVGDLHGLIWEWSDDFNAWFMTADNRADGDQSRNFFCGNAVTGAANREDYAAFMRYAMRSSLAADFALGNLGFRCAYSQDPDAAPPGAA